MIEPRALPRRSASAGLSSHISPSPVEIRSTRFSARPWRAVLYALLALGIGGQAQMSLAGSRPADGCVLYLAAALLFAVAFGDTGRARAAAHASPAALRSMPQMRLVCCGGASILLALAALVLFEIPSNDGWAWLDRP
jgi:hypothetical protein